MKSENIKNESIDNKWQENKNLMSPKSVMSPQSIISPQNLIYILPICLLLYKYDKKKIHIEDYLFLIVSFILISLYSSIYFKDHYYHGEIFGDDIPNNYHTKIRGKAFYLLFLFTFFTQKINLLSIFAYILAITNIIYHIIPLDIENQKTIRRMDYSIVALSYVYFLNISVVNWQLLLPFIHYLSMLFLFNQIEMKDMENTQIWLQIYTLPLYLYLFYYGYLKFGIIDLVIIAFFIISWILAMKISPYIKEDTSSTFYKFLFISKEKKEEILASMYDIGHMLVVSLIIYKILLQRKKDAFN